MSVLALLAALTGADWQVLELDKFRAPPSMFFCKGNEADAGIFTVFLRHDSEVSVVDVTRTFEYRTDEIKDRFHDVVYRDPSSGRVDIKMPVASGSNSAEVVIVIGDGPEKATVAWSNGTAKYSAACTSAPVPPGRTE